MIDTEHLEMSKNKMKVKNIAPVVVLATTLFSGFATAQPWDGSFSKRIYVGIGAGLSALEPDTSQVPDIDVIDDRDTAGTVTLGFDFSRRLTAELQYADLGTAGLTGGDGITYAEGSLSGLYYLWNGFASSQFLDYDGLDQRAGLSLYGRLGVGAMDNESLDAVEFERRNDVQLLVGLGLEYALRIGLGIRAEFIRYDTDASYAGGTLLYRFGGRRSQPQVEPIAEIQAPDLPVLPAPEPVDTLPPPPVPPEFVQTVQEGDDDGDGVQNDLDNCNDTPPGTVVTSTGCAMFNGTLEGVNFLTGSDRLTDNARTILDDVVATLDEFPDILVSVEAHTDSRGSTAANETLSRNRALAVVRYLTAQGIVLERFEARAFGETQPIADNSTQAGRLLNRRVELRIIK